MQRGSEAILEHEVQILSGICADLRVAVQRISAELKAESQRREAVEVLLQCVLETMTALLQHPGG